MADKNKIKDNENTLEIQGNSANNIKEEVNDFLRSLGVLKFPADVLTSRIIREIIKFGGEDGQVLTIKDGILSWQEQESDSLKIDSGVVNYYSSDNEVQKKITTTDNASGQTFQPKVVFAIGSSPSFTSMGFAVFNGTSVENQDNMTTGTRTDGWIISFATGTPGLGLQVDNAVSDGFNWTPKNSTGDGEHITWLAIG